MPNIDSAASVARVVSRKLRKNGLLISKRIDSHRMSEGLLIHRVGVGRTVAVSYHVEGFKHTPETDARSREALSTAKKLIAEWGYKFNDLGRIQCKYE